MTAHDVIMGAAGAVTATPGAYIEDVFSTYTYTGNGSSQSINNGVDLLTNGGLLWIKGRSVDTNHILHDSREGGVSPLPMLRSNLTNGNEYVSGRAFTTTGFTVNGSSASYGNQNGTTYASWTFRKQAKFFDVVTYTGNGSAQTISHNLGSAPGAIIIKKTSAADNWAVYHRNVGNSKYLFLNTTAAEDTGGVFNNYTPTASDFQVAGGTTNANGATFVAYLFAHNAGGFGASGTENVISCGSYAGTGSAGNSITLGWEPQFILLKRADAAQDWFMLDTMRGVFTGTQNDPFLQPNTLSAESTSVCVATNPTGFTLEGATTGFNASGGTYIYIAIRRGPMRAPTSGTSVFSVNLLSPSASAPTNLETGFPVDLSLSQLREGAERLIAIDRVRGTTANIGCKYLQIGTATENAPTSNGIGLNMTSITDNFWGPYIGYTTSVVHWSLRRAPSFFDIVTYTGNGAGAAARAIPHNLGVTPELIICKYYSGAAPSGTNWYTYSAGLTSPTTQFLRFDTTGGQATSTIWASTAPTAANFTVATDTLNFSGTNYIAYLFATCPGVSKVGTYTGNGTSLTVDCGFSTGARFVLIKRIDTLQNWIAFDSARGIVAGNDPFIATNTNTAETTTLDAIDPVSSGFIINNVSGGGNISGGKYIFLAIA